MPSTPTHQSAAPPTNPCPADYPFAPLDYQELADRLCDCLAAGGDGEAAPGGARVCCCSGCCSAIPPNQGIGGCRGLLCPLRPPAAGPTCSRLTQHCTLSTSMRCTPPALLPPPPPPPDPTTLPAGAAPTPEFVSRNGTQFWLNGQPLHFFGFNHPALVRYAASNDSAQQVGGQLWWVAGFYLQKNPKTLKKWGGRMPRGGGRWGWVEAQGRWRQVGTLQAQGRDAGQPHATHAWSREEQWTCFASRCTAASGKS